MRLSPNSLGLRYFLSRAPWDCRPPKFPLLGDFVLDFNLAAGVVIWPVVFITTDIINEYYGKRGVRADQFFHGGLH